MDKVAEYFDACADEWEERFVRPDAAQDIAARIAGVKSGMRVADIGCGTGIMTPIYLRLGVAEAVGIDVSPRMIAHAADKFESESCATFVCSDATTFEDQERFDAVVAYNCYPHFLDREALARNVAALLRPGGRFVVAHSMGRSRPCPLVGDERSAASFDRSGGMGAVLRNRFDRRRAGFLLLRRHRSLTMRDRVSHRAVPPASSARWRRALAFSRVLCPIRACR